MAEVGGVDAIYRRCIATAGFPGRLYHGSHAVHEITLLQQVCLRFPWRRHYYGQIPMGIFTASEEIADKRGAPTAEEVKRKIAEAFRQCQLPELDLAQERDP